jgi:TolB-like protein
MALTFRHSAEEPPRCALEIAEALQKHPELRVRMGIHSGPVSKVTDVSGRTNLAGAGINMAQRVMDCGDAGHILLSQHVADDLVHSRQWAPRLQDLGECEVKHGVRLHLVNLYAKPLGNPEVPAKIRGGRVASGVVPTKGSTAGRRGLGIAVTVLGALLIAALVYYRSVSTRPPPISAESTPQSLAVLPLRNLSGDQAQDYFAEGVTDSLTTGLAQIHSLRVLSFQSVQKYRGEQRKNLPEIARELNVDAVVEGSVQKSGDTVMINAQLIQAPGDRHLWAERYTRNARDMLAAESEIVLAITDAIKVQLTPGEKMRLAASRPIDPEAQSHYFLGRFH